MKTFYLIDGHAQLFRAYYAPFRDLTSPTGENVKAVYVFTQMLLNLLKNVKPDYLAVAFDVSDSTTHRKGWFPEYKANREASPEDLHGQFLRIRQIVGALRLPIFELEGYEADDLIATIARRLAGRGVELRIGSKDKDLHQILTDQVKLWDPSSGDLLDVATLLATRGYAPEQAVEIQTLTGDSTDNIPGARGVGVKTAARLIAQFGTAEEVVANAAQLTPKLRENLLAHAPMMPLTRRLVTLDQEAPLDFDLEACATPRPTRGDLKPLFDELGFRSFGDWLPEEPGLEVGVVSAGSGRPAQAESVQTGLSTAPAAGDYRVVNTPQGFAAFLDQLSAQPVFCIDTETTALRAVDADIVGYAFSWKAGTGWYLPVRGDHGQNLDPDATAAALRPILERSDTLKVGQNLKYDIIVLDRAGIRLGGPLFDTMVAAALLFPQRRTNNMDDLARDLLQIATTPITDLIGKGKTQISMLQVPLDKVADYAAEDADVTWRLYERLAEELEAISKATPGAAVLGKLFQEVEMPLVRVLAAMEREGVALDAGLLEAYAGRVAGRIEQVRAEAMSAAGIEFNPDSPKQLAEVLFDRLALRVVKTTKTGRSTDAEVLETLAAESQHLLPRILLEYRELSKLLGTYLQPLPGYLSKTTGRLHASFHQTGAATGRLSSSDPNIQNIPIRTEMGREVRRAFTARDAECLLLTADYSQVELRMLAHFSADEELSAAFFEGRDIHAHVASQIFDVPLEAVTPDQRRIAKTVNFGIIYGQTAFGLARTLRIPQSEAGAFIAAYKERYTGLERFLRSCVEQAEELGYVTTILGRRRAIEEVRSRNRNLRQLGERLAINTVIQGSAADLIKVAMVRLDERLRELGGGARLLIQVHDELVLETPRSLAEEVKAVTVETMTHALDLRVPLKVDVGVAHNWLEGKA